MRITSFYYQIFNLMILFLYPPQPAGSTRKPMLTHHGRGWGGKWMPIKFAFWNPGSAVQKIYTFGNVRNNSVTSQHSGI